MKKPIPLSELVRACAKSSDPELWKEFVHRVQRFVASVALATCLELGDNPRDLEDRVQEVFTRLCANDRRLMKQFKHHHDNAFLNYLKAITVSVVVDHHRKEGAQKRGDGRQTEELTENMVAPGGSFGSSIDYRILLNQCLDILRRKLDGPKAGRDIQIFLLYFRHGLSAAAIAKLPGIELTTEGVESTILRLTKLIRKEIGE